MILAIEMIAATRSRYSDDRPGPGWDIGAIIVVLGLSLAGLGLQQWHGHRMQLTQFVPSFGEARFTTNEQLQTKLTDITTFRVENGNGRVQVKSGAVDQLKVGVEITATAETVQEAERLTLAVDIYMRQEGQKLTVTPTIPMVTGQQDLVVNLVITIPDQALATELLSQFGSVETNGLPGSLNVESKNGTVNVTDNHGSVAIINSFGNVRVKGIEGDLNVQAGNGMVEIDQVSGSTVIRSSFGRVELRNIHGRAEIDAKNGGVLANDIGGDLVVTSAFGSTEIGNPNRQVTVKGDNGSITVSTNEAPRRPYHLTTKFGSIRVRLPKASGFRIEATSDFGRVELPVPASTIREGNRTTAILSIGSGGPLITLRSENGSVAVEYR